MGIGRSEVGTHCLVVVALWVRTPPTVPRIQRVPRAEPALKTPDEWHDICVCTGLQRLPPIVPQAVPSVTGDKHLPVHLKLVRVVRIEINTGDDVVQVAGHLCEVEGVEKLEVGPETGGGSVSLGDTFALPFRAANVECDSVPKQMENVSVKKATGNGQNVDVRALALDLSNVVLPVFGNVRVRI